jgi:hypothetical protein
MSIKIPIISDFDGKGIKKAIAEFKSLETTSEKAQFAIKKAAVPATAALAGLATMSIKAAQAAGDLNEAQNAANVLFGESAKDITAFSKTAARSLGLSQIAAIQAATAFAGLGKAAGLQGADLANFSKQFTTLAADMASFMNTSPEDAIQAIGAALRGEAEPIRRYNVLLDDATLKNRALKLGLISSTKEALTPATKALAAQAEILEQTSYMQGDFANTSGGAAGQQKILAAELDNASRSFGQLFIPALETVLPLLSGLAGWAAENGRLVGALTISFGGMAAAIVATRIAMVTYKAIAAATTVVNGLLAASGFAVQISTGVGIVTAIAGMTILTGIAYTLTGMFQEQEQAVKGSTKAAIENAEINQLIADKLPKFEPFNAGAAEAAAKVNELTARLKQLRSGIKDDFAGALESARGVLAKARDDFSNFASNVSDAITGAFSFSEAQKAGKETGRGFLAALTDQVTKTRDFSVKINRLLAAGLSEGAIQQVLAAGQDAGGAIADELLNGGAAAIAQANALTAEVQTLGDTVGQNAAVQFRQAGVDAGTAMVAGITETISKFQVKLRSKKLTPKQLARLQKDFGVSVDFLLSGGQASIPALADGGIVKASPGGTLALIGEGGRDEAVIPLDRAGGIGGNNINVYVQGADPNAVVDALRTYMFRNGSVPIRVS